MIQTEPATLIQGARAAAATAEALTQYAASTVPSGTGNASGSGMPTTQPYAQKVRELLAANPNQNFDLVYIDEDDIPELLVDWLDVDVNRLSLYTFADNNLYTLKKEQIVGIRDYMGYFSRENLVELSSAALSVNQWETSGTTTGSARNTGGNRPPPPRGRPGS